MRKFFWLTILTLSLFTSWVALAQVKFAPKHPTTLGGGTEEVVVEPIKPLSASLKAKVDSIKANLKPDKITTDDINAILDALNLKAKELGQASIHLEDGIVNLTDIVNSL